MSNIIPSSEFRAPFLRPSSDFATEDPTRGDELVLQMLDPSGPVLLIQRMADPPDYAGRIKRYRMANIGWQSTLLDCFLFKDGTMKYVEVPGARRAVKLGQSWVQQHMRQQRIDAGVEGIHHLQPIHVGDGSQSPHYAPSSPGYEEPGDSLNNPIWVEEDGDSAQHPIVVQPDEEEEKERELIAHDESMALAEAQENGGEDEEEGPWEAPVQLPPHDDNDWEYIKNFERF
jgi:hypothetical protein